MENSNHIFLLVNDQVEDSITLISLIKELFPEATLLTAQSGAEGLALANTRRPHLILIDLILPHMGYELCGHLKSEMSLKDIPVILITARSSDQQSRLRALEVGVESFLSKPIDPIELCAQVRTMLKIMECNMTLAKSLEDANLQADLARTAFLRSQLRPHFIFNALSVITSLCYVDGKQAGKLLEEFSNYLRYSFDFDPHTSFVSLEEELSLIHSYLAIEKKRFAEMLEINYLIDEKLLGCRIPTLILQPLVENAIQHGLLECPQGGMVEIKARQQDNYIQITVKDDGVGIPRAKLSQLLLPNQEAKGLGISNIQQRLLNIYGEGLEIESNEGRGTLVSMKIPRGEMGHA